MQELNVSGAGADMARVLASAKDSSLLQVDADGKSALDFQAGAERVAHDFMSKLVDGEGQMAPAAEQIMLQLGKTPLSDRNARAAERLAGIIEEVSSSGDVTDDQAVSIARASLDTAVEMVGNRLDELKKLTDGVASR